MDEKKYLDQNGLLYYDTLVKGREDKKVDKEFKTGSSSEYKVLSDNNLTDELKQKILDAGTGSFTGNYDDLFGIPTLDGTQIKGTLTKKELDIASAYDLLQLQGDIANAMADIEEMQQEGYQTEEDVQNLIDSAIGDITGIDFKVVDRLPDTGEKGVIYLVSNEGAGENTYNEYIWLEDKQKFEKIGTTDVDLSDYVKKEDLVAITNEEIEQIVNPS